MNNPDWYTEWCQRMHEIYNSQWDEFLREYVFSVVGQFEELRQFPD